AGHFEHRAEMVALGHAHGAAGFFDRDGNVKRTKDADDREDRGAAAVVEQRAGPVEDHGLQRAWRTTMFVELGHCGSLLIETCGSLRIEGRGPEGLVRGGEALPAFTVWCATPRRSRGLSRYAGDSMRPLVAVRTGPSAVSQRFQRRLAKPNDIVIPQPPEAITTSTFGSGWH